MKRVCNTCGAIESDVRTNQLDRKERNRRHHHRILNEKSVRTNQPSAFIFVILAKSKRYKSVDILKNNKNLR